MRAVALISALAMLASLFLPWIGAGAFGGFSTPWGLISTLGPDLDLLQAFVSSAPLGLLLVLGSLALAVLFILGAALGYPSRAVAGLSGAITIATIGYWLWSIRQGLAQSVELGMDLSRETPLSEIVNAGLSAAGTGAWCWAIGGLLLFITSVFGYGRNR